MARFPRHVKEFWWSSWLYLELFNLPDSMQHSSWLRHTLRANEVMPVTSANGVLKEMAGTVCPHFFPHWLNSELCLRWSGLPAGISKANSTGYGFKLKVPMLKPVRMGPCQTRAPSIGSTGRCLELSFLVSKSFGCSTHFQSKSVRRTSCQFSGFRGKALVWRWLEILGKKEGQTLRGHRSCRMPSIRTHVRNSETQQTLLKTRRLCWLSLHVWKPNSWLRWVTWSQLNHFVFSRGAWSL